MDKIIKKELDALTKLNEDISRKKDKLIENHATRKALKGVLEYTYELNVDIPKVHQYIHEKLMKL